MSPIYTTDFVHNVDEVTAIDLEISFTIQPKDPDVGIFSAEVDEWWITGLPSDKIASIVKNMSSSEDELISEHCMEVYNEW